MKIDKTCPACKSENIGFVYHHNIVSNSHEWKFVCHDCGRATKTCETDAEAWDEWNRRAVQE